MKLWKGVVNNMELCLYEPMIAQNAGTLTRLCACLNIYISIIEPASFIIG